MHISIIVLELPTKLQGSLIKWIEWEMLREWPLLFAITHQWSGYSLLVQVHVCREVFQSWRRAKQELSACRIWSTDCQLRGPFLRVYIIEKCATKKYLTWKKLSNDSNVDIPDVWKSRFNMTQSYCNTVSVTMETNKFKYESFLNINLKTKDTQLPDLNTTLVVFIFLAILLTLRTLQVCMVWIYFRAGPK